MINKICVYAICKNEASFVDKWYNSMKEADLIVVLDTGSTDNTVELLKQYSPKVQVYQKIITPWRFDVARNESLALVPDEYNIRVCTDLDEILEPGWAEDIKENWQEDTNRAYYKYAWSHTSTGQDARVFWYDKVHNNDKWSWKFPVHEALFLENAEEKPITLYKMKLHHYPDYSKSRSSYLPLLIQRKSEYPEDYYGLIYLAHEYTYQKYYTEAIKEFEYILTNFRDKLNSIDIASIYLFMGDNFYCLKDTTKAIDCYNKSIEADNTYRESYLKLASVYIELKYYEVAKGLIYQSLSNTYRHFTWLERDSSWTYEPYDLLTLACYYSDDFTHAAAYAAKALQFEENNCRLKSNLELCLNKI